MMKIFTPRILLLAIGIFCFGVLAVAWVLQYGPMRQQPCPLCILQRYVYILLGMIALAGSIHFQRGYPRSAYMGAALLTTLTGFGFALWQVLKGADMTSCREDPIGVFVNGLPTADWFPQYFFANGGCSDKYDVLGIPVPVLSLIAFVMIAITLVIAMVQVQRQKNAY
jgi:protein dithiol:quinone oxidoreductase